MPFGPDAPGARDHIFDIEDGVRSRLRFFPGEKEAPNILFFHGNGETARDYDPVAEDYQALPASFAVGEYRGYGPTDGQPSIVDFLGDAHSTLDELKKILAEEQRSGPVVVMGRSLGSAPAIELAASRPGEIAALIIESGFSRIVPLLELIGLPARQLGIEESHGLRNGQKMETVSMPTLIIHAEDDEIIPISEAELNHDACRDPGKRFLRVPRAGHNDIQLRAGAAYFEEIASLLARI
jgi:pimeloyl-ACP methyl ester carboxylesterase